MMWLLRTITKKHLLASLGIMMVLAVYHIYMFTLKTHDKHLQIHRKISRMNNTKVQAQLNALRKNSVTHNLADLNLDKMTRKQLFLTLHSYLDNVDVICQRRLRMGHLEDGGWEVCDDLDVRPIPPCIVYSYGINNDWSFDDDISNLYGCHVFSFDPSMNLNTHNRSNLVHFHNIGIFGHRTVNEKNWQLYRHEELRALLHHEEATIDIIKMDVENAEWSSLDDMVATDQFKDVKQFLIEFHVSKQYSLLLKKLRALKSLEVVGFKRFYVHKNKNCRFKHSSFPVQRTRCYEVHYIKRS